MPHVCKSIGSIPGLKVLLCAFDTHLLLLCVSVSLSPYVCLCCGCVQQRRWCRPLIDPHTPLSLQPPPACCIPRTQTTHAMAVTLPTFQALMSSLKFWSLVSQDKDPQNSFLHTGDAAAAPPHKQRRRRTSKESAATQPQTNNTLLPVHAPHVLHPRHVPQ